MQTRHSTVLKALAGLAFGLALTATSAQAQTQVCVQASDPQVTPPTITVTFNDGQYVQASSTQPNCVRLNVSVLGTSNGTGKTTYSVALSNNVICQQPTAYTNSSTATITFEYIKSSQQCTVYSP